MSPKFLVVKVSVPLTNIILSAPRRIIAVMDDKGW